MIRLLVADDHPVVRSGVRGLFRNEADIRVAAEAATVAEAVCAIDRGGFDAVLLDLAFPDGSGFDVLRFTTERSSTLPVIVFTNALDVANRCLAAGAMAFLSKESGLQEIRTAILAAMGGRKFIGTRSAHFATASDGADQQDPQIDMPHVRLSPRELDIMLKLVRGKRAKEIACELDISEKTVATHRARLMKKLKVEDTRQLILYALKAGLTEWC